jgi:hypothetical protein
MRKIYAALYPSFILSLPSPSYAFDLTHTNTPAKVCFNPDGGCSEAIVAEIGAARSEILVQAYSPFTSAPVRLLQLHEGSGREKCGEHADTEIDGTRGVLL